MDFGVIEFGGLAALVIGIFNLATINTKPGLLNKYETNWNLSLV